MIVVVLLPEFQLAAGGGQGKEDFHIQAFVTQFAVKTFDVSVLPRRPGR